MNVARIAAIGMYLATAAPVMAADPVPDIGPPPSWIVEPRVPSPDPARSAQPFQMLVSSTQERILADGIENYIEYATVPQTTAGLQMLGNVTLPWNTERTELMVHKVTIRRGDKAIDLLKPNEFVVLRRENNLEKATLDGIRTVVIPIRGLQTGDVLQVAATYKTKKSSISNTPEEVQTLASAFPVNRIERRFVVPDGVSVRWKVSSGGPKPVVTAHDGVTEHMFVQTDTQPLDAPKFAPARYTVPIIQVSAYAGWADVAREMSPLYDEARRLAKDSPLAAEAAKIMAASADPSQRMLAALRLAQERVRYVALILGDGAYVPAPADVTWERKFGDCKGKTALLLALLDQLKIDALPVMVSNSFNDRIGEQLPSLALFDHVLVRVSLDGHEYILDPTNYGQRTLDELQRTPYTHGLPLVEGATLEKFVEPPLTAPLRDAELVWDASSGFDAAVPYQAKLTLRGSSAATMRSKLGAATDKQEFEKLLKDMIPTVANDDLIITQMQPEAADGSFVVQFAGKSKMDWSPFEGEKDSRFAFSHSTVHWSAEFDREKGPGKDWPVVLDSNLYWERASETVILPNGGKRFRVDGAPIHKSLAGSRTSRTFVNGGDRITMVSEFRHDKREISAEEARAAGPMLDELNDDWAYIVGPPQRKKRQPPR